MNQLILNDQIVETSQVASVTLLDFIRYEKRLRGTKIGCREGDCGACTVLLGNLENGELKYRSVTSCIAPLGSAFGKHVVTVDGLKIEGKLSRVQEALVSEGGTQCGFCTPGFVVSLTGYCLSRPQPELDGAVASIDGNICRCTGYKSIERGAARIVSELKNSPDLAGLVKNHFLPRYFLDIPSKLESLTQRQTRKPTHKLVVVGGGTDLYVQRPEDLSGQPIDLYQAGRRHKGITRKQKTIRVDAATTATELLESKLVQGLIPNLSKYLKLVSSTQIRNMGTVAGNIVNASPIGDLTILFLALNASLVIREEKNTKRRIQLRDFYLGYKKLAKEESELVESIEFPIFEDSTFFHFEKVSKRTHLDIASVNSAIQITTSGDTISEVHLSAGGVGPVPTYLAKTSQALVGQTLNDHTIKSAADVLADEISPISDVRGSREYKRLLLRQLFFAHFLELFPTHCSLSGLR